MRKITIASLIVLFCFYAASAQKLRPLAQQIQDERQKGTTFQQVTDVFSVQKDVDKSTKSSMLNAQDLTFLNYDYKKIPEAKSIKLLVPLEEQTFEIDLQEMPDTYMDFTAHTSEGKVVPENRNARYYQGIITGDNESLVAISFFEDEVIGLIANSHGNYVLGKDPNSRRMMIYNDFNLKQAPKFNCSYDDNGEIRDYLPEELETPSRTAPSMGNCVNMHFTTEFDVFEELGSATAVDQYLRGVFHQVSILYYNDGISTRLSDVDIWTTPDPFTATTTADLLNQYEFFTGSFNGDVSQLLTFRTELDGGRANLSGLCFPFGDDRKKGVAEVRANFNEVPVYSRTVNFIAHEFGHILGAKHTHDCVWNGNNTAIDHCGSLAGFQNGEDYGGQECFDQNNPRIPFGGGTIMSYCHLNAVGINLNEGFQAQVANVMNARVDAGWCLNSCEIICDDLCDIEADITSVSWSTTSNPCRYKFIARNLANPMCIDDYSLEWRIEGVIGVVSTAKEFIYDFSNFTNGSYNVDLKITHNGGLVQCVDTATEVRFIGCGVNPNPTCPSANAINILEAEPCIDYMAQMPFNSSISSITWKYNIHGVNGEQTIATTGGPGPYSVPFSLNPGHDYDNHYLVVIAYITLTNGNTCRISKSRLIFCPGGGGGGIGGNQRITLSPNPTKDNFEIFNGTDRKIIQVVVRDIYGNIALRRTNNLTHKYNLTNAITGVYFVEITLEDGFVEIQKLILEQ